MIEDKITEGINMEGVDINKQNEGEIKKEIDEIIENVKAASHNEKEKDDDNTVNKTIKNVDKSLIDSLANLLSSEVKAKIYIYLRKYENSTVEEIAHGTGIYPSTIREAILEMYREGIVTRGKLDKEGSGKKPYVYSAIPPSEIVKKISKSLQKKLNDLMMVDKKIKKKEIKVPFLPVKIVIDENTENTEN